MKTLKPADVKYIVIHCSATREDQSFGVKDLRKCHIEEKHFSDIGYHYYITRDALMHPCRPLKYQGAHVKGCNHCSVGVCYEGGLDKYGDYADTRTDGQKAILSALIRLLRTMFPEAEVVSHHDLDPHKLCPCFDARKEYAQELQAPQPPQGGM